MLRRVEVIIVVESLPMLSACAVGWNHTSDAALEENFAKHRREIETLLAEVEADARLETLQPGRLMYAGRMLDIDDADFHAIEDLGLSDERWQRYQRELRRLRIVIVAKGDGGVEFRVDSGSLSNGDSYKGYWYASSAPCHTRASLDGYRISDQDKDKFGNWCVCKPLITNWCLYLFVNR